MHKDIGQAFIERVAEEIKEADYSLNNGNYLNIINERNALRIAVVIAPDKVFIGGEYSTAERFIEPTALRVVNVAHSRPQV